MIWKEDIWQRHIFSLLDGFFAHLQQQVQLFRQVSEQALRRISCSMCHPFNDFFMFFKRRKASLARMK